MTALKVGQKLEGLRSETKWIMDMFDDRGRVSRDKVAEAQDLFRALKEKLRSEHRRMDTVKGQAGLTSLESAFYRPAIGDAWAKSGISSVRWNSRPDKRWFTALWNVSGPSVRSVVLKIE